MGGDSAPLTRANPNTASLPASAPSSPRRRRLSETSCLLIPRHSPQWIVQQQLKGREVSNVDRPENEDNYLSGMRAKWLSSPSLTSLRASASTASRDAIRSVYGSLTVRRAFSSFDDDDDADDPALERTSGSVKTDGGTEHQSVTMISTRTLPKYSTERYYMLSELHEHAQSVSFLPEMTTPDSNRLPPYVALYLLFPPSQPGDQHTTEAQRIHHFVHHTCTRAVQRLLLSASRQSQESSPPPRRRRNAKGVEEETKELESKCKQPSIYLVVDWIYSPPQRSSLQKVTFHDGRESTRSEQEDDHMRSAAECLAKSIASTPFLRRTLKGVTVGVVAHPEVRAAPGLEVCLEMSCLYGAAERRSMLLSSRRFGFGWWRQVLSFGTLGGEEQEDAENTNGRLVPTSRSFVGLVCDSVDDLRGLDGSGEADASQNVSQLLTTAEWNSGGNHLTFASRAQRLWRKRLAKKVERGGSTESPGNGGWEVDDDEDDEASDSDVDAQLTYFGPLSHRSQLMRRRQRLTPRMMGVQNSGSQARRDADRVSTIMVSILFLALLVQWANEHGDAVATFVGMMRKSLAAAAESATHSVSEDSDPL